MEDQQYKLEIESCFKQLDKTIPNVPQQIIDIVQENKEKRREEIRKAMYESYIKKKYGNKVKLQEEPVDKRKMEIMNRLRKKLEFKKNFQ
jgi:translation initiation factor IF-1